MNLFTNDNLRFTRRWAAYGGVAATRLYAGAQRSCLSIVNCHWVRAGRPSGRVAGFAFALFPLLATDPVWGQGNYGMQGGEYGLAGALPGDQVKPHLALKPSGGYVVWQDNFTDGSGWGVSARRLDGSFSGTLGTFRVNEAGDEDQNHPQVGWLNNGGAVFAWQGGRQGFQRIYARFLSGGGTWATGDVLVNSYTNSSQTGPVLATLTNGSVVVSWSSYNQEGTNSMWGVYAQRLDDVGQKLGGEFRVNQTTAYNQRSSVLAALADGGFVAVWVTEQQRFENSVDIYARLFDGNGMAVGNEFLVNVGTNVCANPAVASSGDGGFVVVWTEKDLAVSGNSWEVYGRRFTGGGSGGGARLINGQSYGDQIGPRISAVGPDYLVVWTSLGQDGSREGVYGQFLQGDGSLAGGEFRVNTTTASQQIDPAVGSDGSGRFLVVWSSFGGGVNSFDLQGQRYALTQQPLMAPDAPYVTVLSSTALSVTWPGLQGLSVANYEVYADEAGTATAVVTNQWWTMSGLAAGSTHTFRLAYGLTDGRRSPLSGATTNRTYGAIAYFGIPTEWMAVYFGEDWPLANADNDGDGVSNRDEWLAGTNPTNATSVLVVRLQPTAQGLFLDWNTEPGLMYQVQAAAAADGGWTNVGEARFAAGATDSMYVGGGNAGFYRIVRLR